MIIKQRAPYNKLISVFTLAFFLANQSAWALPQAGISVAPQRETPSFLQIEIPQELASVEEVYEAPAKADPKLILHIQNVHGNYETQLQIKKLLDYLYQKYGFKLLFAEGAAERLNPDLLRFFPDAERNQRFAEYMAKKGQLTGIEYYLMNGPGDVEAVGIEEKELYRQNYEAFRKVYGAKEEVNLFLDNYEGQLEMLSSRVFPQNTRRLLSEWRKFETGHRDFLPYVQRLAVDAKSVLGLDLQSLFAQVEWPQITRLLALQSMEKEMDRTGAEKEKTRLIEFLKTQQAAPELITAIEKLTEQRITMERLTDSEKKLEDLPRYLLERLVNELGPKGFRFHDYPAFSLWAGYLILQNELDSRLLFEEIEKVFAKVLDEMSVTEREKNLLELYRDAVLLRKLLHLELTRKEWDRVLYRKDWMSFTAMEGRMKKIAAEAEGNFQEEKSLDFKALTQILDTSYDFYGFARKRESAFFEKIQAEMTSRKTEKAILVTGGFHTDGLMEIFREKEINCGILMPRMNGTIDTSGYASGMLENNPTMFDLATIEFNNAMQTLLTRGDLGADAWSTVRDRLNDFVTAGVYRDAEDMLQVLNSDNRGPFANLGFELVRSEEGPIAIRVVNADLITAIQTAGNFGVNEQGILTSADGTMLAMKVLPVESKTDRKAGYGFVIGPIQQVRGGESLTLPQVAATARSEQRDARKRQIAATASSNVSAAISEFRRLHNPTTGLEEAMRLIDAGNFGQAANYIGSAMNLLSDRRGSSLAESYLNNALDILGSRSESRLSIRDYLDILSTAEKAASLKAEELRGDDDGPQNNYGLAYQALTDRSEALRKATVPADANEWWALPNHGDDAVDSILFSLYNDALTARNHKNGITEPIKLLGIINTWNIPGNIGRLVLELGAPQGITFADGSSLKVHNVVLSRKIEDLGGKLVSSDPIKDDTELEAARKDLWRAVASMKKLPFSASLVTVDDGTKELRISNVQARSEGRKNISFSAQELRPITSADADGPDTAKALVVLSDTLVADSSDVRELGPRVAGNHGKTFASADAYIEAGDEGVEYTGRLIRGFWEEFGTRTTGDRQQSRIGSIAASLQEAAVFYDGAKQMDVDTTDRISQLRLLQDHIPQVMQVLLGKYESFRSEDRSEGEVPAYEGITQDDIDYGRLQRFSRFSPETRRALDQEIFERIDHGLPLPMEPRFAVVYSDDSEEPNSILITFPAVRFNQHEQTLKTLQTLGEILTERFGVNPETRQPQYEAQIIQPSEEFDPDANYGDQKVKYGLSLVRSEARVTMSVQKAANFVAIVNSAMREFRNERDWLAVVNGIDSNPQSKLHKLLMELYENVDTKRSQLKDGTADSLDLMMIVGDIQDINKLIQGGEFEFINNRNKGKDEPPFVFIYKPHTRSEGRLELNFQVYGRRIYEEAGIPIRFQVAQGENYWNITLDAKELKAIPAQMEGEGRYPEKLTYHVETMSGTVRGSIIMPFDRRNVGTLEAPYADSDLKESRSPVLEMMPQIARFVAEEIYRKVSEQNLRKAGVSLQAHAVHMAAYDPKSTIPTKFEMTFPSADGKETPKRFQFIISDEGAAQLAQLDLTTVKELTLPYTVIGETHTGPIGTLNFHLYFPPQSDGELKIYIDKVRVGEVAKEGGSKSDLSLIQRAIYDASMNGLANFTAAKWNSADEMRLVRSEARPISVDLKWVTGSSIGYENGAYRVQIADTKLIADSPAKLASDLEETLSVFRFRAAVDGDEMTFTAAGQTFGPVNFRDEKALDGALQSAVAVLRSEARLLEMPRRDFLKTLIAGAATMSMAGVSAADDGDEKPKIPVMRQDSIASIDSKILAVAKKNGLIDGNPFAQGFTVNDIDDTLRNASPQALQRHFAWRSVVMEMAREAYANNFTAINAPLTQSKINDLARFFQILQPSDIAAASLAPLPEMDRGDLKKITLFRNPNSFLHQYGLAIVKLELGTESISELPKLLDPALLNAQLASYILPALSRIGIEDPAHPRAVNQREELLYLIGTVAFTLETNKVSPVINRNGDPAALINFNPNFTIADWLQYFALRKTAQNLADEAAAVLVNEIIKADMKAFNLRKQGIEGAPEVKDRIAREQVLAEVFPFRIETGDVSYVIEQLTKLNEQYRAIATDKQAAEFLQTLKLKLSEIKNAFVKALALANPDAVEKHFPAFLNHLDGYNLYMLVSQRADIFEKFPVYLQMVLNKDSGTLNAIRVEIASKNASFQEDSFKRLQRVILQNPRIFAVPNRSETRLIDNDTAVQVTVAGTPAIVLNLRADGVGDRLKPRDTIPSLVSRFGRTIQDSRRLEDIKNALLSPQLVAQIEALPAARDIQIQRSLLLTALSEIKPVTSQAAAARQASEQILEIAGAIPVGAEGRQKYFAEADQLGLSTEQFVAVLAGLTFANATVEKLSAFVQTVMKSGMDLEEAVQQVLSDNDAVQMTPSNAPAAITVVLDLSLKLTDSDFLNDENGLFESIAAVLKPYKNAAVSLIILTEKSQQAPAIYQQKIQALQARLAAQDTDQKRIHLEFATLSQLSSKLTQVKQSMKVQGPLTAEQRANFADLYAEVHISTDDSRLRDMTDRSSADPESRFEVIVENLTNGVADSVTSTWVTLLKPLNLMKQAEELVPEGRLIEEKSGRYRIIPAAINSISGKLASVIQALRKIEYSA